jgi:pimeloyl-ACP methyl ester carboxylesterase
VPTATVNGVKLYYEVSGSGKDIVFLHGYIGDIEDFRAQINFLSPSYRVLAIDQRGRGKSEAPKREEDYSIRLFVDDVYQWLRQLKVEKCCLVGHSLGGMVALEFAFAHQVMLSALVLTDTSSGAMMLGPEESLLLDIVFELAQTKGTGAAFDYYLENDPATKARFRRHPETLERMRKKTMQTSINGYIFVRKAIMKRESVTSRLSEITVPTLIVYGGDDIPFVNASKVLKEGISDSELVMISGVGHGPMYEAPDSYNQVLMDFLKKVGW